MRVRLLPSTIGAGNQSQALTTFLVDGRVAIDGGSIGYALAPEEMRTVRDVVVTHAHSDHTASLPIFVAEAYTLIDSPIAIYGLPEVVAALRNYIFNDQIWPDFEKIDLAAGPPTIALQEIEPRKPFEVSGITVTPIPVNHIVPTVGLLVDDGKAAVLITSDTYVTDEIWKVGAECDRLRAVFVDVSYPNELEGLAAASKHLTPQSLASELTKLNSNADIYAVHIKPSNRGEVIRQLKALKDPIVQVAEIGRTYEW